VPWRRGGLDSRASRWTPAAALAGYGALAFLYFGLAIVAHPGRDAIGRGTDSNIFIWSFGWWPHAILHGENPVFSHAIWAPIGINLAWAATAPGVAILFAPVTLLAGPVAGYNAAAVLMPALAAWTAFLLCRYLTGSLWPSLAGGYLFGFSSYMLGHEEGHLHMTAVFLIPLVFLVVLRYVNGVLDGRGLALRLGILLGAQLWFSTELFATLTLALIVALALALALVGSARSRLRSLVAPVAAAYGIGALIASPVLYYAFTDFASRSVNPPDAYVADLANLFLPTQVIQIGGAWATRYSAVFPGNEAEQSAYLGLPTLAILGLFLLRRWTEPSARFLIASFVVAVVAAFGTALHLRGQRIVAMPWRAVADLPIFNHVIPGRLMLFATLAAAVMVALWAASSGPPRWLRVVLPVLAVLALFPNLQERHVRWARTTVQPAFFTEQRYERCIDRGENVLVIPYGFTGDALVWQAQSGFHFRMAGGHVSPVIPAEFARYGEPVEGLIADHMELGQGPTLLPLLHDMGVSTMVVYESDPPLWPRVLAFLGEPKRVGGVLLYPVGPDSRASSPLCA
jgi:hypothetical protein